MESFDVYARFEEQVRIRPTSPALLLSEQTISYAELYHEVLALRRGLRPFQVAGKPVGVYTAEPLLAYAGILAILGEGGGYVPINHRFPAERNHSIVEQSGIVAGIYPNDDAEAKLHFTEQVPAVYPLYSSTSLPTYAPPPPESQAYLLFTSGSTGKPKGVPIHHGALRSFVRTVCEIEDWKLGPDDVFLQMFELTFDLSAFSFLVPVMIGAACAPVPVGGAQYLQIAQTLEEKAATVALMVPSALAYLRPYFDEIDLPHLRLSLFCGEALPVDLTDEWAKVIPNAHIENVYGPTEATIFCTRYPYSLRSHEEALNGVMPIGTAMSNVETLVLADDDQEASEGELCLSGAQVTAGYWRNPEKTAEAFVHHGGKTWYRTGDRCLLNASGTLLYLGRTDQQVKVNGFRIELGEIEHHARLATGAHLAVVAVQTSNQTSLHLFSEPLQAGVDALRAALTAALPSYMIPSSFTELPSLPLNSNGKIDRPALRQMILDRAQP